LKFTTAAAILPMGTALRVFAAAMLLFLSDDRCFADFACDALERAVNRILQFAKVAWPTGVQRVSH
jgi:hypothetical protein